MDGLISGITLTPLKQIKQEKGDIFHAMKSTETGFQGFGEAYFSFVKEGFVKGWKKHNQMLLNIIVPLGEIKFVIHDNRPDSITNGKSNEITLGPKKMYARLTIEPGLWVAFQGVKANNCLLNIASLEHDPKEADNLDIDAIPYAW
jgi:dTDP-4-dehydrorhamnose 3,5-epimerase